MENLLFSSSFNSSVQRAKIYEGKISDVEKLEFKKGLKNYLDELILRRYVSGLSSEEHQTEIESFCKHVSNKFSPILNGGEYRIGIAQKLFNLYLKHLWSLGRIASPPHIPIDSIILAKLTKLFIKRHKQTPVPKCLGEKWTELCNITTYKEIIKCGFDLHGEHLQEWELETWNNQGIA